MPLLGFNVDHIATLRQARGTDYPCPVVAAMLAENSFVDSITVHLREDRRHIQEDDVKKLKNILWIPLNLEIAATEEMLMFAKKIKPSSCCIVPEKRHELTTESGLDVVRNIDQIKRACDSLAEEKITVSLFVDPDIKQIDAAKACGASTVELHTGNYANHFSTELNSSSEYKRKLIILGSSADGFLSDFATALHNGEHKAQFKETTAHLNNIKEMAKYAASLGLTVHAGHGLTNENVKPIVQIREIYQLNIGHSLVSEAVFLGIPKAIDFMLQLVERTPFQ